MSPDRRTTALAIVLLLGLLGASAIGITDPVIVSGAGGGEPGGLLPFNATAAEDGADGSRFSFADLRAAIGGPHICAHFLLRGDVRLAILLGLFGVGLVLWRAANVLVSSAILVGISPILFLLYLLLTVDCFGNGEPPEVGRDVEPGGLLPFLDGGGSPGDGAVTLLTDPTVLFLGLVLIGLVAVAVLFAPNRGSTDAPPDEPAAEPTEAVPSDIAAVAGAAADRLEAGAGTGDLENEVYRAWMAMTDRLDLADPDTVTPGEFAGVAIEAGMAQEDVRALTRLFEEVRYGERPVTERRERTAVETLRRIERSYGGDG